MDLIKSNGFYIVLDHFTRVIGEVQVDNWSETRLESPLRNLMLACFGYQPKPFSIHLPQCLDSSSFLKMINSLVFEWIAIFSRSALSPCPSQSTVFLRLTSVVLNWSDPGEKCVELMYEAAEDANDVFVQVSVKNRKLGQAISIPDSPISHISIKPLWWILSIQSRVLCPERKPESIRHSSTCHLEKPEI